MGRPRQPIADRFWKHVRVTEDGCWEWQARRTRQGYGQFVIDRGGSRWRTEPAHRVAWELTHGVTPPRWVLHHCDNPPCCNPEHLYDGTAKDNARDRNTRGRANCPPPPHVYGSRHPRTRLTEADVREIKKRYAMGGVSQQALADGYGVNQTKISAIVRGVAWKHVVVAHG